MLSDFNFETRFGMLSSWCIFLAPKLKKIDFFAPLWHFQNFNNFVWILTPHKILYTVFLYCKAIFETLSSKKLKSDFHSILMYMENTLHALAMYWLDQNGVGKAFQIIQKQKIQQFHFNGFLSIALETNRGWGKLFTNNTL